MNPSPPNPKSSSGRDPDKPENRVDVAEFQSLNDRQLDALISQRKISLPNDATASEKIHSVIEYHASLGDTLVGSGTLQVLPDGFGFLRSRWFNYLGGPDDIYVSPSQIRKFGLANGDTVEGQIRPPKDNERFFALLRIFQVNQLDPDQAQKTDRFEDLKPVLPDERIPMEFAPDDKICRLVDMISPIGFGQRGIVVGPPRSGKTRILTELCESMLAACPDLLAFMLLVDQRPEEIIELEDLLNGPRCEVISSVFDSTTQRHNDVSMMVLEKAKRRVELGEDVVIFLDSLTKLACFELGPGCRFDELESDSLPVTCSFLAAAKQTDNAGTLTIISSVTVDSANEIEVFVAENLRGTANMELRLDEELVRRRIWPAINLHQSQSQQEEKLLGDQYDGVCQLRRSLGDYSAVEAMETLLVHIKDSDSNSELLKAQQ